jgi:hypothetical protein
LAIAAVTSVARKNRITRSAATSPQPSTRQTLVRFCSAARFFPRRFFRRSFFPANTASHLKKIGEE